MNAPLYAQPASPHRPSWRHRFLSKWYRSREHPGRLRLIGLAKKLLRLERVRVEVVPGVVMELDDRDFVQREILYQGGYELATLKRFDSLMREATGCTDFGAHMGLYTLRAARALAPRGGRVFAIEPTPPHSNALLQNAALSGLNNISVCTAAVSDAPAILRMIAPHEANTGGSKLAAPGAETGDPDLRPIPLLVPVLPGGALAGLIPETCLDVVKLDVEGHEFRVLRSLFAATPVRPRHLLFEYRPLDFGANQEDLPWLKAQGYELLTIDGDPFAPGAPLPDDNLWARRIDLQR